MLTRPLRWVNWNVVFPAGSKMALAILAKTARSFSQSISPARSWPQNHSHGGAPVEIGDRGEVGEACLPTGGMHTASVGGEHRVNAESPRTTGGGRDTEQRTGRGSRRRATCGVCRGDVCGAGGASGEGEAVGRSRRFSALNRSALHLPHTPKGALSLSTPCLCLHGATGRRANA